MPVRVAPVVLLLLACPVMAQPPNKPALPNPLSLLNTGSTDALAGNFRAALVKAMFLDPLSPRLKSIPTADTDWARTQLAGGDPFLQSDRRVRDVTQHTASANARCSGESCGSMVR